ncbi:hypothetical protein LJR098_001072 [Rhizobium sp. LjRoot98]|uniref:hypothetical protein n=1 Tax=Rhizobium sp. LjRoot98 TaxID=3342345 RepID=UPI003ED101BE
MTETKLEQTDNAAFLSPDDFLAAIMPPEEFFEVAGKKVKIRGANAFDLFKLIKRFPKARALVHNIADVVFGSDKQAEDLISSFNSRTVIDILIDIGDDAGAAYAAICLGKGDDEAFEKDLQAARNDVLLGLLNASLTATFGGKSPQDFFTGLLIEFEKMGIRRGGQAKKKLATKANRQVKTISSKAA